MKREREREAGLVSTESSRQISDCERKQNKTFHFIINDPTTARKKLDTPERKKKNRREEMS